MNKTIRTTDKSHIKVKKEKNRSELYETWRRLKKDKLAVLSLGIIILVTLMAIFSDFIYDYDTVVTKADILNRLKPPSAAHPFGTDEMGRDLLARIVYGSKYSLSIGLASLCFSVITGCFLGLIAGYFGGTLETVIMRISDILSALPSILLGMVFVSTFGQKISILVIAIGISSIPAYVRVTRARVMTIKDQEFIEAAKAIGLGNWNIIFNHILPNASSPIIVQASMSVANNILSISMLSFLGLGIPVPAPEWGTILSSSRPHLREAWWLSTFPGVAIVIVVLAFNLLGDGLRDALDPRLKN